MKILHVISSGGMYGAEAVILDLSRALGRLGHPSEIGLFENSALPNTELTNRARGEGIRTHAIPCAGQLDLAVPARLRTVVETERVDVVHSHGYKGDVYAFWGMRSTRVPLVATCHNWIDGDFALRLYGRLDRFALRRFRGVAAVSEGVQQRLLGAGVSASRVMLIRNGVDLEPHAAIERRLAAKTDSVTIGIVARLSPEKGVDIFLQAAALIIGTMPRARFLVAGEGPDRNALETSLDRMQLREHVSLLGRQEDMPAFYASLDILVLSSRTEGLPMALLEGMASGLPVVATCVGEVPQVVQENETGYVVPVEDPPAIAAAVLRLGQDPALRQRLGTRAKAHVSAHFSADRMATEYLHFYEAAREGASDKTRNARS